MGSLNYFHVTTVKWESMLCEYLCVCAVYVCAVKTRACIIHCGFYIFFSAYLMDLCKSYSVVQNFIQTWKF